MGKWRKLPRNYLKWLQCQISRLFKNIKRCPICFSMLHNAAQIVWAWGDAGSRGRPALYLIRCLGGLVPVAKTEYEWRAYNDLCKSCSINTAGPSGAEIIRGCTSLQGFKYSNKMLLFVWYKRRTVPVGVCFKSFEDCHTFNLFKSAATKQYFNTIKVTFIMIIEKMICIFNYCIEVPFTNNKATSKLRKVF